MQYSAINIQGNIISGEVLEKIRTEDAKFHQSAADFGLNRNTSVRDEIGIAWAAARAHWQAFKMRRERLKEGDSGTSETRQGWMIPFLRELGYELEKSTAELINGKTYAISHRAVNRDDFPVHIVGINQSLDRRPETGGTRLSPHALLQEYLNNHEHLYALITNGQLIRLLRDATRLSRLSYLEFDIERMMEEELFAEFALLFRVIHATRMPMTKDTGEDAFIEKYHQIALSSGSRIREKLSEAVESSLKQLANGLLQHPANSHLRELALDGTLKPAPFYLYLLRLVYRILFLMVIEERQLIYPDKRDETTNKLKDLYYRFYSINRLTRLAERMIYIDPKKTDLWQSLVTTFRLFESGEFGEKLGIKPLGSGLFEPGALGNLMNQNLDNGTLLKVLQMLVTFKNDNNQDVRVNYADFDVEEFGSVYEGLLEYDASLKEVNGQPVFSFVTGDARSRSGSHYTPEELVKPLIKHSLDYLIEDRLKEPEKFIKTTDIFSPHRGEIPIYRERGEARTQSSLREAALLSLRICDVACGSGHILLSAARRIAHELACLRENAEQPSPPYFRAAMRDVIKNCIYGVDKNPLAVELCKVALWLESHNPGEPLGFLDHHIKCGDSIVGLAHRDELENGIPDEAFKTLPGDKKEVAAALLRKNREERKLRLDKQAAAQLKITDTIDNTVQESITEYRTFNRLPERTPEEITAKARAYKKLMNGKGYSFLKAMADTQVAQFFIPKTTTNKDRLITDSDFMTILQGFGGWQNQQTAFAGALASQRNFFHWFLEFPEVFNNGGFDCILGNPPYLGNKKLSGYFGNSFLTYSNTYYVGGSCDLITFFIRRIFQVIKVNGFLSIISTNTISQGGTREGGLDYILNSNGTINYANKSIIWPGKAAVIISLLSIVKSKSWHRVFYNTSKVHFINSFLDSSDNDMTPKTLQSNKGQCFIGSTIEGVGFVINSIEYETLIKTESLVVKPYLTGSDLLNNLDSMASRYIIDFGEMTENEALNYSNSYAIVKERVKPHRDTVNRERNKRKWWIYAETRPGLYGSIANKEYVLARARISKTQAWALVETKQVLADALVVTSLNSFDKFCILQSTIHSEWAWKYCTTMKNDMNYGSTTIFETFPFPQNLPKEQEQKLETIGETYHEQRRQLMLKMQLGLTKTYNAFHAREINESLLNPSASPDLTALNMNKKAIEKKYGKEVWNLWSHLQKTEGVCAFEEAVAGILQLRRLHVEMDNAVLEAYGWYAPSPSGRAGVGLSHNFYEVDYLPENDRIRYTIHPDARKEILKRLLELNHQIHDEEVRAGLWDKKKTGKKEYASKGSLPDVAKEDEGRYGQGRLF